MKGVLDAAKAIGNKVGALGISRAKLIFAVVLTAYFLIAITASLPLVKDHSLRPIVRGVARFYYATSLSGGQYLFHSPKDSVLRKGRQCMRFDFFDRYQNDIGFLPVGSGCDRRKTWTLWTSPMEIAVYRMVENASLRVRSNESRSLLLALGHAACTQLGPQTVAYVRLKWTTEMIHKVNNNQEERLMLDAEWDCDKKQIISSEWGEL